MADCIENNISIHGYTLTTFIDIEAVFNRCDKKDSYSRVVTRAVSRNKRSSYEILVKIKMK